MKTRTRRYFRPDSLAFLFLFVALGMLFTLVAQSDDYLQAGKLFKLDTGYTHAVDPVVDFNEDADMTLHQVMENRRNGWLLPGGIRASLQGGLAHLQIPSGKNSSLISDNTQLIFSVGFIENQNSKNNLANETQVQDWYDLYQPTLLMSVGHRFK